MERLPKVVAMLLAKKSVLRQNTDMVKGPARTDAHANNESR